MAGEDARKVTEVDAGRMSSTLKEFLLNSAGAAGEDDDDSFEDALLQVRASGPMGFFPNRAG